MPEDGSTDKSEGERIGSIVERAMKGARFRGKRSENGTSIVDKAVADAPPKPATGDEVSAPESPPRSQSTETSLKSISGTGAGPEAVSGRISEAKAAPAGDLASVGDRSAVAPARPQSRIVDVSIERLRGMGFITHNQERTRTTEEFRVVKRSILQGISVARSEGRRNPNLVMITSARPSEGKTFNAVNLAISIASEPDLNTLLIDADLVKPAIFKTFGIEPGPGLIDIIESGDFDLSQIMVRTNIDGLTLLDAGTPHPMATEFLASERMHRFVDEVAQRYDDRVVIFDGPPILSTSEASVLSGHMSQIVFIVEADGTSRNQVKEALDMIGKGPSVGVVLNKASARFGARNFGGYYNSYSKS